MRNDMPALVFDQKAILLPVRLAVRPSALASQGTAGPTPKHWLVSYFFPDLKLWSVVSLVIAVHVLFFLAAISKANEASRGESYEKAVLELGSMTYESSLCTMWSISSYWWQLRRIVVSTFLSNDALQFIMGLYSLSTVGPSVTGVYGGKGFLIIYLASGIVSNICVAPMEKLVLHDSYFSGDLFVGSPSALFGLVSSEYAQALLMWQALSASQATCVKRRLLVLTSSLTFVVLMFRSVTMLFNLIVGITVGVAVNVLYFYCDPRSLLSIAEARHGSSESITSARTSNRGSAHSSYTKILAAVSAFALSLLVFASLVYMWYDVERLGRDDLARICKSFT